MEKVPISSNNEFDDQIGERAAASNGTPPRGEGEDTNFSYDVSCIEHLHTFDSGSSSVSATPDAIIPDEKKQIVQRLEMKPIMFKKVKQTKVIKLFGVVLEVCTDVEYTTVFNPKPLNCFNPNTGDQSVPGRPDEQRGGRAEDNEEPAEPQMPVGNFSRLLRDIAARVVARPVFLYKKKLTKSDLSSNLNRLFITRSRVLMGILRDEERRRVQDEDRRIWLDVAAVDPTGESYRLHLKLWSSLNMVVLNGKAWSKIVSRNQVEVGQLVELWAYREEDNELHLALNFN